MSVGRLVWMLEGDYRKLQKKAEEKAEGRHKKFEPVLVAEN